MRLTPAVFKTGDLLGWSAQELARLFFLQAGMAPQHDVQPASRQGDIVGLLGRKPIAAKLHALTVRELSLSRRQSVGADARQLCAAHQHLTACICGFPGACLQICACGDLKHAFFARSKNRYMGMHAHCKQAFDVMRHILGRANSHFFYQACYSVHTSLPLCKNARSNVVVESEVGL